MARRTRITVNPNKKEGGWTVKEGGEVIANTKTQQAGVDNAVNRAKSLERGGQDAQVLIKNREGQVRDERSFGHDPEKTPG